MTNFKAATVLVLAMGVLAAGVSVPAFRPSAAAQTGTARADDRSPGGAKPLENPKAAAHGHAPGGHHHAPAEGDIRGSGKHVTRGMDFSGFTSVDVGRSFQVNIRKADAFRTEVTADDNLFPYIHVEKDGKTLKISLDTQGKSFWATALKVTVAMPTLEGVTVDRGGRVTCTGFRSDGPFTARVSGRGTLKGEVEAGNVDLDVFQGGVVELKGAAKEVRISATGTCQLKLSGLAADRADVRLRDASSAAIKVKEKLDFDLDGVSRLEYDGDPFLGKQRVDGGSSFLRIGDSRGAGVPFQGHDHMHALQKHHQEIHAGFPHLQFGKGFTPPGTKVAPKRVEIGQKVPDFVVSDLDGKQWKLSELQKDARRTRKGVVVLSFWCSFCGSCRRVEERLDKLARDYQGQAAVLALDASAGETAERVRAFCKQKGLSVPVVLDPGGRTADLFGTEVTTTTVVIDGEGRLRYCGRFSDGGRAFAEDALRAVLDGKAVPVPMTPHDGCRIIRQ
jgi:thiol-disulfide isomerase/thioredoxin